MTLHSFAKKFGRGAVAFVLFVLAGSLGAAQEKNSEHTLRPVDGREKPEATLAAAAWLTGYWQGEGLGGRVEEVWSEASGSSMMGMFRLLQENETRFYELMQLIEIEGTLQLRVKHFNLDFTGWEEKDRFVTFPLVRAEPERLFFGGLTIERVSEDALTIYIVLSQGGVRSEEKILLRRKAF